MTMDIYEISVTNKIKFSIFAYICCFIILFLFYRSNIVGFLGAFGFKFLEKYYKAFYKDMRKKESREQLKDLLYQISSSVSAGRNMENALSDGDEYLSKVYDEKALFLKELKRTNQHISKSKMDDLTALSEMAQRCQLEDLNNFVETYSICKDSGGNLSEAVRKCTIILIEKMEIEKEIEKTIAQRKIECGIVALMPVVILIFLNFTSFSYLEVMYQTYQGKFIMSLALIIYIGAIRFMVKFFEVNV